MAGKKRGRRRAMASHNATAVAPANSKTELLKVSEHDSELFSSPAQTRRTGVPSLPVQSASVSESAAKAYVGEASGTPATIDMNSPAETILVSEYISPVAADNHSTACSGELKPLQPTISTLEDLERKWSDQKQSQEQVVTTIREFLPDTCRTRTEQSVDEDTARVGTIGRKRPVSQSVRCGGKTDLHQEEILSTPATSATTATDVVPGVIDVQLKRDPCTAARAEHDTRRSSARTREKKMSVFDRLSNQSTASSRRKRRHRKNDMSHSRSAQSLMTAPMSTPPAKSFDTQSLSTLSHADSVFDRLHRNQRRTRKHPNGTPGSADPCEERISNVDDDARSRSSIDDFSARQARVERRLTYTPNLMSKKKNRMPRPMVNPGRSPNQVFDRLYKDSARAQASRAKRQIETLEHPSEQLPHDEHDDLAVDKEMQKSTHSMKIDQRNTRKASEKCVVHVHFPESSAMEGPLPFRKGRNDGENVESIPLLNDDVSIIDEIDGAQSQTLDDIDIDDECSRNDEHSLDNTKQLIDESMGLIDDFLNATNQLMDESIAEIIEEVEVSAVKKGAEDSTFSAIEEEINRITHLANAFAVNGDGESKSALLIQKHFRGYLARRTCATLRHENALVSSLMQSALSKKKTYSESRSDMVLRYYSRKRGGVDEDTPLQRLWCGEGINENNAQGRKKQATILIQNEFRRSVESFSYQRNKESAIFLQRVNRGFLVRNGLKKKIHAAVAIQSVVRGYSSRQSFASACGAMAEAALRDHFIKKQSADYTLACIKVQTAWRARQGRRRYNSMQSVTVRLQALARRLIAIDRYNQLRPYTRASIIIQKWTRDLQRDLLFNRLAVEEGQRIESEKAVSIIQRNWRRYRARLAFVWGVVASTTLQRMWRGYAVRRKSIVHAKLYAIRIQSRWRSYQARRAYSARQSAVILLQSIARQLTATARYSNYTAKARAAVTIQSWARGLNVRNVMLALHGAAICVQRAWRGRVAREKYLDVLRKVILIQTTCRSYRTTIAEEKKRTDRAAAIVQNCFRGYHTRQLFIASRSSAIVLQAQSRRVLTSLRIENQSSAAKTVQCSWRGYVVRKEMRAYCQACILVQAKWRAYQAYASYVLTLSSVITLQAEARRLLGRLKYLSQLAKTHAALCIQRSARGVHARRKLQVTQDAALLIQQAFRASVSRRQQYNATINARKIQSLIRSYQARSRVVTQQRASAAINSIARAHLARKRFASYCAASIVLQRSWRGSSTRRLVGRRLRAACTIQASFRRYCCRQKLRSIQKQVIILQALTRALLVNVSVRRKKVAASAIQRSWERYCLLRRRKLVAVVVKIQSWLRGCSSTRAYEEKKTAVIHIQSVVRGKMARREAVQILVAVHRIQRAHMRFVSAVHVAKVAASVALIQSSYRSYRERTGFLNKVRCAIVLQSSYRSHRARTAFLSKIRRATVLQAWARSIKEERGYSLIIRHVTRIQRMIRRQMARKRLKMIRNAAVIQKQWQSHCRDQRLHVAQNSEKELESLCHIKARVDNDVRLILNGDEEAMTSFGPCVRRLAQQLHESRARAASAKAPKSSCYSRPGLTEPVDEMKVHLSSGATAEVVNAASTMDDKLFSSKSTQRAHRLDWDISPPHLESEEAAVKIQSICRGNSARRSLSVSLRSITLLQAWSRSVFTHRRIEEERAAAKVIQSSWRGYLAKRYAKDSIQACIRIQARWRAHQMQYSYMSLSKASGTLQRFWRGFIVRRSIQRYTLACVMVQSSVRSYLAQRAYVPEEAAMTVQSAWRTFVTKRDATACINVQTRWRSFHARRCYTSKQSAAILLQSLARARIASTRYNGLSAKTTAAMAIQRWARKKLMSQREALMAVLSDSAICIQQVWRGHVCRVAMEKRKKKTMRRMMLRKRRLERTAVLVQSKWRGHCARQEYNSFLRRIVVVQAWSRGIIISKAVRGQRRACERIQSVWRAYVARRRMNIYIHACIRVQAMWRTKHARHAYTEKQSCAILLQSVARQHSARAKYRGLARQRSQAEICAAFRNERGLPPRHSVEQIKGAISLKHIITVQSFVRMIIVRQRLLRANDAARCIQVHYLTWKMHMMTEAVEWAAATIQRAVRSRLLYIPPTVQDYIEWQQRQAAVVVIQRFVRHQLAKKRKEGFLLELEKPLPWIRTFERYFGY